MALYPLCHHGKPRREALTYPARKIAQHVSDPPTRADLLTTLSIFGKLMYPDLNVIELIGRQQMKESKFFEEVMHEGGLVQARLAVLDALDERFGPAAATEFRQAIECISETERLREMHRLAIRSRRLADFRRAFGTGEPARNP